MRTALTAKVRPVLNPTVVILVEEQVNLFPSFLVLGNVNAHHTGAKGFLRHTFLIIKGVDEECDRRVVLLKALIRHRIHLNRKVDPGKVKR
jgi:hypothetical protein